MAAVEAGNVTAITLEPLPLVHEATKHATTHSKTAKAERAVVPNFLTLIAKFALPLALAFNAARNFRFRFILDTPSLNPGAPHRRSTAPGSVGHLVVSFWLYRPN
jgi:hypothetical protein